MDDFLFENITLIMQTTTVDIEPWNDQTIPHNQDSQSGGNTIDHSMEVIILEIDMCQFLSTDLLYYNRYVHKFFAEY